MKSWAGNRNAALAEWYLHGWHRLLWMLPLSAGLSVFVILIVLRGMSADPYANAIQSRAAILTLQTKLPDERNAFVALRTARATFPRWNGGTGDSPQYQLMLDKEILKSPKVIAYWESARGAIQEIQTALALPEADAQFDYTQQKMTGVLSIFDMRETSNDLAFDALMHTLRGEHDQAARSIAATHQLSEHIGRDASMLSLMMTYGSEDAAYETLRYILTELPPLDGAALRNYQRALRAPRDPYALNARTFEFEHRYSLYYMDQTQLQRLPLAKNTPGRKHPLAEALTYGPDRDCVDAVYRDIISSYKNRICPTDIPGLIARHQRGPAVNAHITIPTLSRCSRVAFQNEDQVILMHAAFAVCLYQQKYHADPKAMSDLVPEFLPKVPEDSAGGQPVRLKRFSGEKLRTTFGQEFDLQKNPKLRLLLYSVGENRVDDEGLSNDWIRKKADDVSLLLREYEAPPKTPGGAP